MLISRRFLLRVLGLLGVGTSASTAAAPVHQLVYRRLCLLVQLLPRAAEISSQQTPFETLSSLGRHLSLGGRAASTEQPRSQPDREIKLKSVLRKAAARSLENLWAAIGSCLADFPAPECAAYLASTEYDQPYRKML
jgi:hypothetical protein